MVILGIFVVEFLIIRILQNPTLNSYVILESLNYVWFHNIVAYEYFCSLLMKFSVTFENLLKFSWLSFRIPYTRWFLDSYLIIFWINLLIIWQTDTERFKGSW